MHGYEGLGTRLSFEIIMCVCVCLLLLDLYLIAISSSSVTTTTSSFYPLPPPLPLSLPPIHCQVFMWGCTDEGALGRDGDEYTPLPVVKLKDHVIRQVSACLDSHTATLTNSGCVYFWGVFRVSM